MADRARGPRDRFFPNVGEGAREFPRVYSREFLDAFWGSRGGASGGPALDVSEDDERYFVTAELPGATHADLHVELEDGVLTIRGEKKFERAERGERQRSVERWFGAFSRAIALPADAAGERAEASLDNGVLTVTVAKRARREPRGVEITGP
jgi:HSP20 family protein